MKLVIVESPTKAKTISRFLGPNFKVTSSYGHIRDLPKSQIGVDIEHNFKPTYVIPPRARKAVSELKKLSEKADELVLATDEDREGEAIAWHIAEALDLGKDKKRAAGNKEIKRIVFHEITKSAIEEALKNPRSIDMNLVDAQQARRILDRLVGYNLSPLLWKKVMRGLSAGRVQSVAVRLIVERERERQAFKPQEYWSLDAELKNKTDNIFKASLWKHNGKVIKDLELGSKKEVDDIIDSLKEAQWSVAELVSKKTNRNPLPPFTTSTLQQDANRKLYFSAKQTMVIAQQLYEGIDLGGGREGLITYMRTDSTNLSKDSRSQAQKFIGKEYGINYSSPKEYKKKNRLAQEAHEAIRPTDPTRTPDSIRSYLDSKQFKLYDLIWRRFIASQMSTAVFNATTARIQTKTAYEFKASGLVQVFDGFLKVWQQKSTASELPELKEGQELSLVKLLPERHETQPPGRYSEATLVKALEEHGIGRPSTYAPIMSTIQERNYVEKDENKKFYPTEIGIVVNNLLVEHFPKIVDIDFTARMEDSFDSIASGQIHWQPIIEDFYKPFQELLKDKEKNLERSQMVSVKELGKDPQTKKPVSIRIGRYGPYIQRGQKEDDEKPEFAAIPKDKDISKITLKEALELLALPRSLGKDPGGQEVQSGIGRYGPYIKIGDEYASLPQNHDPLKIGLEEAITVFKENKKNKGKQILKEFPESEIKVASGRYGPYITDGKNNASVPKDKDPNEFTLEEAKKILEEKPKRGRRKKTKKEA